MRTRGGSIEVCRNSNNSIELHTKVMMDHRKFFDLPTTYSDRHLSAVTLSAQSEVQPMSSSVLRAISFLASFKLCVVIFIVTFSTAPLDAQFDTTVVPHRYIVVYRNATIPGDAEVRANAAGAHLLHRNERFGMAVLAS